MKYEVNEPSPRILKVKDGSGPQAISYARAGSWRSSDAQLTECRRTAEQYGLTVLAEYADYCCPPRFDRLTGLYAAALATDRPMRPGASA
jgi:hypothetical protein